MAYGDQTITLNLGHPTPATLAQWVSRHNDTVPAWLITAYNPGGEVASDADNHAREHALAQLLERNELRCLRAVNRDTGGNWPNEPGWLVAGLEEGMARSLGRRFGQAAIVSVQVQSVDLIWIDAD
ncbi:DUF3293 domain-containing protein [Salinisphaera sp. SPP-AMP-43]|uniref:DUF3293 domain-containing protein n=1 Tax=Salinisphaera sp. SPP-AMP-43 TaxID=3121288 RepID=UPI003C6E28DE